MDRRKFLAAGVAAAGASAALSASGRGSRRTNGSRPHRRIATEEAWSFPEHQDALAALSKGISHNLDVGQISPAGSRSREALPMGLVDTTRRLDEMDRLGIDMHLLSLTSPGVQLFRKDYAVEFATVANDRLAEVVRSNPTRFGGLASFAPQDPAAAAKEMERSINQLNLNGFIVNSHTDNEYLDLPKYWPIFEAAEALDRPIYIHPRSPSDGWANVVEDHRMQAAIWGFAIETGTHAMRLMLSGVFDRFPKLQIVLGHMGENIPFHLWRSDHWFERRRSVYKSKLKPSEVMKRNFYITNSGVEHGPALKYAIEVLGADRIMWAVDYPYEAMPPSVQFMNEVDISEEDRASIFHRNAERLFHIRPA